MRVAKVLAAALGLAALGATAAAAGDDDKLIFGSMSSLSVGGRDLDLNHPGGGSSTQLNSTSAYNIPIWRSVSLQIDGVSEYYFNTEVGEEPTSGNSLAAHLSYRVPSKGLIGVFGGYSWSKLDNDEKFQMSFFGAEAQLYQGNWTFYVQGGVGDNTKNDGVNGGFNDGWFGRGVVRYFLTPNTKLEGEIAFAGADSYFGGSDGRFRSWGVSLDQKLFDVKLGAPLNFPVYGTVAYRNSNYQSGGVELDEQVVTVGVKVLFGAKDLKQNDRNGATLDTPMLPIRANAFPELLK